MVKLKDNAIEEIDQMAVDEGLMVAGHPNRSAMVRVLLGEAVAERRKKAAADAVRQK